MKAVRIQWDVDCPEELHYLHLPTEIKIPDWMRDLTEIENYIYSRTEVWFDGYDLVDIAL